MPRRKGLGRVIPRSNGSFVADMCFAAPVRLKGLREFALPVKRESKRQLHTKASAAWRGRQHVAKRSLGSFGISVQRASTTPA